MAGSLTDAAENLMLDWINGAGTPTRPTTSLKVALCTSTPTDSAAGTEVSGGSYARANVTLSASSGGSTSNSGTVSFTGMPACTVTAFEIWDSAGTPVRLWWGTLASSKTVNAGDTFEFQAGTITLSLD